MAFVGDEVSLLLQLNKIIETVSKATIFSFY